MTRDVRDAFDGVHTPLVTPFDGDEVDREALGDLVDPVTAGGVDGLVPCGTTGEFASLSDAEYRAVVETTVERSGDAPVMAGAADTRVGGVAEKIRTAADAGADAALVPLPYFHTANDPAGNAAFVEGVADAADLPVYLYNIPSCTGQEIQPAVVESAARHENVLGLKDTGGDFGYFLDLVRRTPAEFQLLQGFDAYLVPGMATGGTGGINAMSNVVPEAFAAAVDAVRSGDLETAVQIQLDDILPLFQLSAEHGFAPVTKAGVAARGVLPSAAVRPPLVELDDDVRADVERLVEQIAASY